MAKNNNKRYKGRTNDTKPGHRVTKTMSEANKVTNKVTDVVRKHPQDLNSSRQSSKLSQNQIGHKSGANVIRKRRKRNENSRTYNKKIWFDDVDKCLIQSSMADTNNDKKSKLVKDKSFAGVTRIVAMDCEMVGTGFDATTSVLARVSIVNYFGHCVYDKFVKPIEEVTDYRTAVSGVRPSDLVNATDFRTVQKEVHQILKDRIIVGHALNNDFKALLLSHPKNKIRDTSKFFRKLLGGPKPSLKKLSETLLGVKVQTGEHDSIEDARAAMRLFTMYRKKWDSGLKRNKFNVSKKKDKTKTNK